MGNRCQATEDDTRNALWATSGFHIKRFAFNPRWNHEHRHKVSWKGLTESHLKTFRQRLQSKCLQILLPVTMIAARLQHLTTTSRVSSVWAELLTENLTYLTHSCMGNHSPGYPDRILSSVKTWWQTTANHCLVKLIIGSNKHSVKITGWKNNNIVSIYKH